MSFSPTRSIRKAGLRAALLPGVAIVAMAVPSSALAGGFTAHIYVPSHEPRVGNESIKVTARRGGQKLSGTVSYRFLFNGQVVSTQKGGSFKHGVYNDTLKWPARAVSHSITLQVVVKTHYGTDYLNWWIRVRA